MSNHALTDAESAALSSLSYQPAPPEPGQGLRLVYSRTNVEDLVGAIARTRRDLGVALTVSHELAGETRAADTAIENLRLQEQRQVLELNRYIDALARFA